jgi:LemA protein
LNQYRRRTDLIPNLAETVKAYAPRENAILDELAAARASAIASQTRGDIFTDGSALAAFQVAQDQVSNA